MNYAVILSGGVGTRMRSDGFPKQYLNVRGKPVLIYALEPFQACEDVDAMVIVASPLWYKQIEKWLRQYGITKTVIFAENGASRQDSVMQGIHAAVERFGLRAEDKVLIHEAVRPLVTTKLICDCVDALERHDSCLPVIPIHDATYSTADGLVANGTVDRDTLCCGQCPEGFRTEKYLAWMESVTPEQRQKIRGCSELPLLLGQTVGLVIGDHSNFKLTRPDDLALFEAHLVLREKK